MAHSALPMLTHMVCKGESLGSAKTVGCAGHFTPHLGERPGSGAHLMCDADGRQDRYEEGGGIVVSMVPDYSVYLDSLI